jgi:small-conductance mechanosensitive channel
MAPTKSRPYTDSIKIYAAHFILCHFAFGLLCGVYSGYLTQIPGRLYLNHMGNITLGALIAAAIHSIIGFQINRIIDNLLSEKLRFLQHIATEPILQISSIKTKYPASS